MSGVESRISSRVQQSGESVMILMAREADAAAKAGEKLTHLLRGEPDFDTPPHIVEAGKKALDAGNTHYTAAWGMPKLREAIATKVRESHGIAVNPASDVLVTSGATPGLYSAIQAVVEDGDEVLTLDPYYGPAEKMVLLAGGRLTSVPLVPVAGTLRVDADAVGRAVTPRTKALLINSPMNPTGRVFTADELRGLGEVAVKNNLVIISDETYDTLVYAGNTRVSIASLDPRFAERTVIVNSFSKAYAMTGWRIGYNVAPKALSSAMHAVYSQSGRMAASFVQVAAIAALTGTQQPLADMLKEYTRRRDLVVKGLKAIGQPVVSPEGTFYVFMNCERFGMPSLELARHIMKVGKLVTVPGIFFGKSADGYIRISFAASDEDLNNGLAGLKTAFAALSATAPAR